MKSGMKRGPYRLMVIKDKSFSPDVLQAIGTLAYGHILG